MLVAVFAVAAGALVANLYYAQPLIASIGREIGVREDLAGSIVGATQIGYGVGLFLLVSLADLVENKRLVLTTLSLTIVGLIGIATATSASIFFAASFLVGLCSTGAQVLIPFIAHLVPEARRGRIIGNVMAGVLTGIMLARPVALFIAANLGWRAVFWCSAGLMVLIGATLMRLMPKRQPPKGSHYLQILRSMVGLFRSMPALRRRALYQSLMFAAFNMFWTAAPIMLAERFGLSQMGIGIFALAGAGGALAAPIAGRFADRGYIRSMTVAAMATLGLTFYATGIATDWQWLTALVVLTIVFDAAIQTNQIASQRIIFLAPKQTAGRVNAIYMTINFIGGAIGSLLGTITYHAGGWTLTSEVGAIIGILLLAFFMTERRDLPKPK
ncbi:MFS transporter [Hyphomicrobium sp. 99]|uniref:MFS transporter n=1 Tax=Hyphomicrobium sp. 99 TaxID=1163419 RepID=UPI0005F82A1E|nr:MFS transporter [Hyphomicrobium sp. 99]